MRRCLALSLTLSPTLPLVAALLTGCWRRPAPAALRPGVGIPVAPVPDGEHGAVVGVVADSALGYPVVGASVFFSADSVVDLSPPTPAEGLPADTTDPRGGFALPSVPPGTRTLAVSHLGYVPERVVVVVRAGAVDTVVVRLRSRIGVPTRG